MDAVTLFIACDLDERPPCSLDERANVAGRDIDLIPPGGNERAVMQSEPDMSPMEPLLIVPLPISEIGGIIARRIDRITNPSATSVRPPYFVPVGWHARNRVTVPRRSLRPMRPDQLERRLQRDLDALPRPPAPSPSAS